MDNLLNFSSTLQSLEVLSRVTYLEGELSAARLQCQHYQSILDSAWGRVTRLVSSDGVEQAQELLDWLEEVKTTTGGVCGVCLCVVCITYH